MANALLQDLSAATTLAGTDLFYVKQAGARGVKATGTQLLALVGTAYVPLAGGTMTGPLTIASGTLTASAPALNVTQTWNQGETVFTGLLMNFTNTASSEASLPLDIQLGGSSIFKVERTGGITTGGNVYTLGATLSTGSGVRVGNANSFQFSSTALAYDVGDLFLFRDAAATLAQRNGTNAQTFKVYGTTDAGLTNYERLAISAQQGVGFTIGAETLGTGADNLGLTISGSGTGTVKLNSASCYVDNSGTIYVAGFNANGNTTINFSAAGVRNGSAGEYAWTAGGAVAVADTAFHRDSAGVAAVDNGTPGTYRDLKLRNLLQTAYQEVTEMTAPSAPATNSVRIYAEDNGSGKTRLMALFATGAAQQLAIEP